MILKRKRIINLAIYKTADWYRDDDVRVLEPTKIPLARLPTKCGRKCEFSEICSFWAPKYRLVGIDRVKTQQIIDLDEDVEKQDEMGYAGEEHKPGVVPNKSLEIAEVSKLKSIVKNYYDDSSVKGKNLLHVIYVEFANRLTESLEYDYNQKIDEIDDSISTVINEQENLLLGVDYLSSQIDELTQSKEYIEEWLRQ